MVAAAGEGSDSPPINTVIVGGGGGCEAFLRMVESYAFGRLQMCICGVADTDPEAPGVRYARARGVPVVTTDYRELYSVDDLELIIELTGREEVRDEIERPRPRHVRLIDHYGAHLFWELDQAQKEMLAQRSELREKVETERERISQIFDSIPDEIVVLDTDMVIRQVNASFLRNNGLELDSITGRHCYDVAQNVRGECLVAIENCPCATVLRDAEPATLVRKHYGSDGRVRYAAIVAAPILDRDGAITGLVEMTRDITHRILLEEVRLHQFMENAPLAAYVKNRQGQYIEVNPATCDLFGLAKAEIQGKTDLEVLPRRAAEVLRRGDAEVLQTGQQTSFYAEVTLRANRVFLSTTKYPVLDVNGKTTAVVGLSRDVTAQKEAEAALTRTREYLQHILANSPMMIVTTDLEENVVSFNPEAESRLGYAAETVIGEPAARLYLDPEEMEAMLRRVRREGVVEERETVMLHRDGTEVPAAVTLSQLKNTQGEVIGTVVIGRDISSRRALVNQVIQSERLAAVGRLAAGVAHEINNPLAVIAEVAGYLDDLVHELPESLPELQEELVSGLPKILAHVRRGRSITSRLLSFARKSEARVEEADVNSSLEEILPFLEKQARLADVVIERSFQPDLPLVRIEELQLQEVLINLITNSIQAMGDRHRGTIWLKTETRDGRVVVTVRDDGPGISEENRDRLFDPFVSTKPLGVGTGLGLSICYGIVKRYGGEIRVQSLAGEGATFQVLLPVYRQQGEEPSLGETQQ